jgi:phosphoglycerate dehydrogenase-like enzyme
MGETVSGGDRVATDPFGGDKLRIAILDDYQRTALSSADWTRLDDAEVVPFHGHIPDTAVAKDDLFETSDVITVHYKLSERSEGLAGARELELMKPTAFLVNTSRGPIVDQDALLAVLRSGAIAGAGLDVYDEEPLPGGHPLRLAPRTVLTPHLGYVTDDGYRVFYGDAVEDIAAFAAGRPVRVLGPSPD